jgi:hypothetical protein
MPSLGLDADGDELMAVSQPIFEFVKAPRLEGWSQSVVVKFLRDRKQYEAKIEERCAVTGEVKKNVTVSIKSSIETHVLDYVARRIMKRDKASITDTELLQKLQAKVATLVNDHVPDLDQLFAKELAMDLRESDISARIANYYIRFDKIVDDNGLQAMLGNEPATDDAGKHRMKLRCKFLLKHVAPEALRVELTRLVEVVTYRLAKTDDDVLHDLMVERALRQQQAHLIQQELKQDQARTINKKSTEAPAKGNGGSNKGGKRNPSAGGAAGSKTPRDPPKTGCLICKGPHWAKDCPTATEEQKLDVARQLAEKRAQRGDKLKRLIQTTGPRGRTVLLNGVLEVPFCPDTGSEVNVVGRAVFKELSEVDKRVSTKLLHPPKQVRAAGGAVMYCRETVMLNLRVETAAGPVFLDNIECMVLDADEDELLLGAPTLASLGIDMDRMFEQLATQTHAEQDAIADDIPDGVIDLLGTDQSDELTVILERLLQDAMDNGFEREEAHVLRSLVMEFKDVFRIRLGADGPAKVEPLRVMLRDGVEPYRAGARRYSDEQLSVLREHIRDLLDKELIYRNNSSRWACPALIVRKSDGTNRVVVDYRPVNSKMVPIAGVAPNLAIVTKEVRGAYGFGSFDFFKGFWQMPLAEDSQEIFSFVTEDGVFTPTRVPQGAMDSAVHFQAQVNECFRGMLHNSLLAWIDDTLLHANTARSFLAELRRFFMILRERNLKLNAHKCKLFAKRVIWCGKVIDGEGVQHDPARLDALRNMQLPPTGAALQHFLCALNWLRDSMIDYSRITAGLQAKLEKVMAERGRRKAQLTGAKLTWTDEEVVFYQNVLRMIERSCKLAFPDEDATLCMFTDASKTGWALIITQVVNWKDGVAVEAQEHELIICRAGQFKKAQLNWSVIEKEGYPIVKACSDLAYLLDRKLGFQIYCDHANLIQIFSPGKEVKQHVKSKLQRWVLQLVGHRYTIHHIAGENNVWADIVSRWGQPGDAEVRIGVCAVKRVSTRATAPVSMLRPLQEEQFAWPGRDDVRREQQAHRDALPSDSVDEDGFVYVDGKLWLPAQARDLVQRVFLVAHCGPAGHRGVHVMVELIERHFYLDGVRMRVTRFINACLLCKHVKGGKVIMRDWTVERLVSKRNECLHVDYLFLGDSYGLTKYVLVMKDELTHYCELVPADSADGETVVAAVLDWHKRFGMPDTWISDNATHFKNAVMEELARQFGVLHAFVPVYTPWINGTVERVNRDILQVLRVMLLEYRLDTRNWVHLLPLIQANLNHAPVVSLGNCAPVELFTGLLAQSQLDTVMVAGERLPRELPSATDALQAAVDSLRESMQSLHHTVVDRREQQRLAAMVRAKGTECNFSVGDYVLWSRIDKRIRGNKLLARWIGPFRVVEALPHSFMVQHLVTGVRYDVHGSRLKYYHDADLDVTAEVLEHVSLQGIVLEVRAIVGHRFNRTSAEWELCVAWKGLQEIEDSWEPFPAMFRDVPALVTQYVERHDVTELQPFLQL